MKYLTTLNEIKAFNQFLGGKWRLVVLDQLFANTFRFKDLLANIEGITPRMLTKELRELEKYGMVEKVVYREVPPRVEYNLTDRGVTLFPILESIKVLGSEFLREIESNPLILNKKAPRKPKKYATEKAEKPQEDIYVDDQGNKFVKIPPPTISNVEPITPLRPSALSQKKKFENLHIDDIKIFEDEIESLDNSTSHDDHIDSISNPLEDFRDSHDAVNIEFAFDTTIQDSNLEADNKKNKAQPKADKKPKTKNEVPSYKIIQLTLF